jgi:hypothetical protein
MTPPGLELNRIYFELRLNALGDRGDRIRTSPHKKKALVERFFADCWGGWSQFEHSSSLNTLYFIQSITFPQRAQLARFINPI